MTRFMRAIGLTAAGWAGVVVGTGLAGGSWRVLVVVGLFAQSVIFLSLKGTES